MINLNSRGRKLVISQGGESIIQQPLYIDGEIDLKVDSSYAPLWKASSNNLMNLVSSSLSFNGAKFGSQFPMQGLQIWESTDPLKMSLTANLYMEDNGGYADVVAPSLTLMNLTIPTKGDSIIQAGFDSLTGGKYNIDLRTLVPPGPNITSIITNIQRDTDGKVVGDLKDVKSKGVFTLKIADYFTLEKVIITSVDCKFSNMLDEDGFPIESELSIEFMTMEVATTDMFVQMLQNTKK